MARVLRAISGSARCCTNAALSDGPIRLRKNSSETIIRGSFSGSIDRRHAQPATPIIPVSVIVIASHLFLRRDFQRAIWRDSDGIQSPHQTTGGLLEFY